MLECVPHVSERRFTFPQYVEFVVEEIRQRADVKDGVLTFRKRPSKSAMKFLSDLHRDNSNYPTPAPQDVEIAFGNADLRDKETVIFAKSLIVRQIERQRELGPKAKKFQLMMLRGELPDCRPGAKIKGNEADLTKHLMFMLTQRIGLHAGSGATGSNIYASDIVEMAFRKLGYKKISGITIRNKTRK